MRFLKVIFATAIVILGIVFIIQNLEVLKQPVQVELNLAVFSFKSPAVHLWGLILFAFFLGVFTASLYGIYELYKQRQTIRQLKRSVDVLGQELQQASGISRTPAPAPPPSPPTE